MFDFSLVSPVFRAKILIIITLLAGCENHYEMQSPAVDACSESQFKKLTGHKLDYDLYLPANLNYWQHSEDFKFAYDSKDKIYWLKNVSLKNLRDANYDLHYKIANLDWHHQFGFSHFRENYDDAVYAVPDEKGIVFKLLYSRNASNLVVELPTDGKANYITFAVKVTNNSLTPQAMIYTKLTESPEV